MAPKYKLIYFPVTGLGEPIRFLLSYLGEEFEDYRFPFEEWAEIKPTTPFGKVPMLEVDGGKQKLHQSIAISRYLGREAGLNGNDASEDLNIDMVVDTIGDLRLEVTSYKIETDEKLQASKKEVLINISIPFYMNNLEVIAKENNGYLANGKFSWADIFFAALSECFSNVLGIQVTGSYPTLKALAEEVFETPKIKAYIAKRPKTDI